MLTRCVLLTGSIIVGFDHAEGQPFLSTMQASKDDPVYTTYAAARARSEYIIDEGYQFSWYDPERPLGFETDNGGSLLFAWKKNGIVRTTLGEYFRAPVVTTSYSDIARYYYYPFEKLRVDDFFLVYSSRIAVEEMHIANESDNAVNISVYPIFVNLGARVLYPSILPENDGVTFFHRESPDGWMIDHSIPYKEHLRDIYLIDTTIDAYGGYTAWGNETQAPRSVSNANLCVEWGLVHHADGTLCTHMPPYAQQIILHNNNDQEILTESAPKWGDVDPNIPGNGYQGCELGNFRTPSITAGDSFTVIFTCSVKKEQGIAKGIIPQLPAAGGIRFLTEQFIGSDNLD
jgi:hypothetical protein